MTLSDTDYLTRGQPEMPGQGVVRNRRALLDDGSLPPGEPQIFDNDQIQPMDVFSMSSAPLWSEFTPLENESPFTYENLTQFFWFPDESPFGETFQGQANSQAVGNGNQEATSTDNTMDPYANWPHVHQVKKGPIVQVIQICDFLHDAKSWNQINLLERTISRNKLLAPRIVDGIRDTVSARIHVMVSKALEQDLVRKIPHLFPPLETVQALFEEYQRKFGLLYPMVHPSTFSESTWAGDEPYSDIGLLFSAIITLGSVGVPVQESRLFAVQLAFLIRNMINETMTRDENQINDVWTMSTSLLITVFSAWCGNKRHAELAEAFRGTFSTVGVAFFAFPRVLTVGG